MQHDPDDAVQWAFDDVSLILITCPKFWTIQKGAFVLVPFKATRERRTRKSRFSEEQIVGILRIHAEAKVSSGVTFGEKLVFRHEDLSIVLLPSGSELFAPPICEGTSEAGVGPCCIA